MVVLQTPYHGQKALPGLASTIILYPTFRRSLYSNDDDFMFLGQAKLSPTSGALPLLFPLPGVYFPQRCKYKASSCSWTCSSDVIFSERLSLNFSVENGFQVPGTLCHVTIIFSIAHTATCTSFIDFFTDSWLLPHHTWSSMIQGRCCLRYLYIPSTYNSA